MIRKIFDRAGAPVLSMLFIVLFIAERRFQLRRRVQPAVKRLTTNALVSLPAFTLLRLALIPFTVHLANRNRKWNLGLLPVSWNPCLRQIFAFLLLDYSNYLWHVLLHKLPILWRFHLVHHTDRDLDVSTAFRFHFGEIIASLFYRGPIVLLSGASPATVLVYEIVFEAATEFHHSNTRLPSKMEKLMNCVVVTPRMHGIHHSVVRSQTDSNYSVIFSFWDNIHRTLRLDIPQDEIVIGAPDYHYEHELTVGKLLRLPFK